jgi:hypothetical protein
MKRDFMLIVLILFLIFSSPASASPEAIANYDCKVERKFDTEREYTSEYIKKLKFSVRLEEKGMEAVVSRCSFSPSAAQVTCDRYIVDKITFDENIKAKKFYLFASQFDFQLFSNSSFVENNGRGSIAYGKCDGPL